MEHCHVLLGEDEMDILEYNRTQLEQRGYRVSAAPELGEVEEILRNDCPDILVLDIMMPDGSGIDLCRKIRDEFKGPILFLTVLGENGQVVQGLRSGGDDYIVKPCPIEVLTARIDAHMRRLRRFGQETLQLGTRLVLNGNTCRGFLDGRDMLLRPKEFRLLQLLAVKRGVYISAEYLYREVWGMDGYRDMRTIWVHISNIRKKLRDADGERVADIQCEKEKGYRLIMKDGEDGWE